ncbi:hypothetical protein ABT294_30415 [Nonomuraea sp. NPDC000554]|uniref:hypothetical protein n=1 Tax=Nonomuraea sp. NPDC000554 TaxID=3154259 RepID=UPI00332EBA34
MGWELPPGLSKVHGLVKDDAPWPTPDEFDRLRSTDAWLDLAGDLQKAAADFDLASQAVVQRNDGKDVDASQISGEELRQRLRKEAAASKLAALGTMFVVILRLVWKGLVVYLLSVLLISLMAAIAAAPAGGLFLAVRTYATRRAFRMILPKVREHIGAVIANTIRRALSLLGVTALVPLSYVALPVIVAAKQIGPFESDTLWQHEVEKVLAETPAGREALAWAREHGVAVVYRPSNEAPSGERGSYRDEFNLIHVYYQYGLSAEDLAAAFVHEVNHARHRGTPDATEMGREEYVSAAVDEEAAGMVVGNRFTQELEQARGQKVDSRDAWTDDGAYQDAVRRAQRAREEAGGLPLTEAEKRHIGERASQQAIKDKLLESPYPALYSGDWDYKQSPEVKLWNLYGD